MTATAISGPALTHIQLTEPALAFDPADAAQQHLNPLAGLAEFGPYSATAWTGSRPAGPRRDPGPPRRDRPGPRPAQQPARGCGPARTRRLPAPLPGLQGRVPHRAHPRRPGRAAAAAGRPGRPDGRQRRAAPDPGPGTHRGPGQARRRPQPVRRRGVLPAVTGGTPHFTVGEFDLHDHVKAAAARLGLPTQIVTDQALGYHCRASVSWRLAMALYAKAGGTPYKLAAGGMLDPSAAYIGLAYGIRDAGRPGHELRRVLLAAVRRPGRRPGIRRLRRLRRRRPGQPAAQPRPDAHRAVPQPEHLRRPARRAAAQPPGRPQGLSRSPTRKPAAPPKPGAAATT